MDKIQFFGLEKTNKMILAFFNKYKKAIVITLASIAINYVVGMITSLFIFKLSLFSHSSFFSGYVPSIIAMIAVLIYLYCRIGVECLVFKLGRHTVIGLLGGILISWVFLRSINAYFSSNPIYDEFMKMNLITFMAGIILIGLISPVLEEIIFRGYLFQSIKEHIGTFIAWIVSVLLSLIVHLIGVPTLSAELVIYLLGGFIIITAVYQIGKIPAAIVVHGFINIYMFTTNKF